MDNVQNLVKKKKVNMQSPLPFFLSKICGEMRYPNFGDLYEDAMLEPIQTGSNIAAGNQEKHLSKG